MKIYGYTPNTHYTIKHFGREQLFPKCFLDQVALLFKRPEHIKQTKPIYLNKVAHLAHTLKKVFDFHNRLWKEQAYLAPFFCSSRVTTQWE